MNDKLTYLFSQNNIYLYDIVLIGQRTLIINFKKMWHSLTQR